MDVIDITGQENINISLRYFMKVIFYGWKFQFSRHINTKILNIYKFRQEIHRNFIYIAIAPTEIIILSAGSAQSTKKQNKQTNVFRMEMVSTAETVASHSYIGFWYLTRRCIWFTSRQSAPTKCPVPFKLTTDPCNVGNVFYFHVKPKTIYILAFHGIFGLEGLSRSSYYNRFNLFIQLFIYH